MGQEDWGQSQGPNFWVDPLMPPDWCVRAPPGQDLSRVAVDPVEH